MADSGYLPATPPRRPRPRAAWFFLGGGLLLLGAIAFVGLLILTVSRASHTDDVATVGPAGQPVRLEVTTDEERMLFVVEGQSSPLCTLTDADGEEVPVDPVTANVTVGTEGTTWKGVGTFTSDTPWVELSCADATPGQEIRVGAPLGAGFVGGIVAAILLPLLLGGTGVLVLIVTTILWATRPPRHG